MKRAQTFADLVREAEASVSHMPDGALKTKGFELILNSLLGGSGFHEEDARRRESLESGDEEASVLRRSAVAPGNSPKEFLNLKKPTSHTERYLCLAYLLTNQLGKSTFSTTDVSQLALEAQAPNFANAKNTANNLVRDGRFLSRAPRGKKRITAAGEAFVEALPDRSQLDEVLKNTPRPFKRAGRSISG